MKNTATGRVVSHQQCASHWQRRSEWKGTVYKTWSLKSRFTKDVEGMRWMKEWAAVAQAGGEGESPSRDVAQWSAPAEVDPKSDTKAQCVPTRNVCSHKSLWQSQIAVTR